MPVLILDWRQNALSAIDAPKSADRKGHIGATVLGKSSRLIHARD
jgi:hypothetical protein